MNKTRNQRTMNSADQEKDCSPVQNGMDAAQNQPGKKKPFMERLGLIELMDFGKSNGAVSDSNSGTVSAKEKEALLSAKVPRTADDSDVPESGDKADRSKTEKLCIRDIYAKYQLEARETSTVYIIESFLKALPDNLPVDVKRQSIHNLIAASRMDLGFLLNDGAKRLDALKKYYQDFAANVDGSIAASEQQIRKLEEQIALHKRIIDERIETKEQQKSEIEFEIQKITNIIDFVDNKNK